MKMKYDLLSEKWIPVLISGENSEVSLRELFEKSDVIDGLAAKPITNLAIIRFCICVIYAAHDKSVADPRANAMKNGLDKRKIDDYLSRWSGRFSLFDEEHPFMQARGAEPANGTYKSPCDLALDRASGNNVCMFDKSTTDTPMPAGECALSLIATQALTNKTGIGALIKGVKSFATKDAQREFSALSLAGTSFYLAGRNLAETLALNLTSDYENLTRACRGEDAVGEDRPAWEADSFPPEYRRPCRGIMDLLTWQTRYVRMVPPGPDGLVRQIFITGGTKMTSPKKEVPGIKPIVSPCDPMLCYSGDRPIKLASSRPGGSLLYAREIAEKFGYASGMPVSVECVGLDADKAKLVAFIEESIPFSNPAKLARLASALRVAAGELGKDMAIARGFWFMASRDLRALLEEDESGWPGAIRSIAARAFSLGGSSGRPARIAPNFVPTDGESGARMESLVGPQVMDFLETWCKDEGGYSSSRPAARPVPYDARDAEAFVRGGRQWLSNLIRKFLATGGKWLTPREARARGGACHGLLARASKAGIGGREALRPEAALRAIGGDGRRLVGEIVGAHSAQDFVWAMAGLTERVAKLGKKVDLFGIAADVEQFSEGESGKRAVKARWAIALLRGRLGH